MSSLFLLAKIADTEVAISSDHIESVVTVGDIVPVPKCHALVAGLIALRSRVLTLIDCQFAITGTRRDIAAKSLAVIAEFGGQNYALSVDEVKDVLSIDPAAILPVSKLAPKWTGLVENVAEVDGRIVMIFSPELLLSAPLQLAA